MEFDCIYLGVHIIMSNRKHLTYIDSKKDKCRIWRENGIYFIDDGGSHIFEITSGNVRQALIKRPEVTSKTKSSMNS